MSFYLKLEPAFVSNLQSIPYTCVGAWSVEPVAYRRLCRRLISSIIWSACTSALIVQVLVFPQAHLFKNQKPYYAIKFPKHFEFNLLPNAFHLFLKLL